MTRMWVRAACLVILIGGLIATLLNQQAVAICLTPQPPYKNRFLWADVVLSGHVVAVQMHDDFWGDMLATIAVDRVWKGDVPVLVTVYTPGAMAEAPSFQEGASYILQLTKRSDDGRAATLVLPPGTLFASQCSVTDITADYVPALLKALGPGRHVK